MSEKIQEAITYIKVIHEAVEELRELQREILDGAMTEKDMATFRRLKASTEKIKGVL